MVRTVHQASADLDPHSEEPRDSEKMKILPLPKREEPKEKMDIWSVETTAQWLRDLQLTSASTLSTTPSKCMEATGTCKTTQSNAS